ncbi:MAG: hypothetical protein MUC87_09335 [Bacteroidia bacterium]|jgi:hypothetical protein|nr:hypothetical protein [Bacteroidia bacterium]
MIKQDNDQLFRLATVLYADNNYEVSTKTIIRKIIECTLLSNDNLPQNIHQIIEFVDSSYSLHLTEEEIKSIITNEKEDGFLVNMTHEEIIVCLTEKRKQHLESKLSNKTIDFFIEEFIKTKSHLSPLINIKDLIYRFLYELLSSNIESFKKLLDNKKQVEDLINIKSQGYSNLERDIINEFLIWDNNDKNKAIFDVASYALEYCMITNNGSGTNLQLKNLKNKVFYLDTNVIYRALGINGDNRKKRTLTFLNKVIEAGSEIVVSKFTEIELKDSIAFYIDKIKKNPLNRPISPEVFNQKYFKSLSDIYDFYYKWRIGLANHSVDLFESHIFWLYEKFKSNFHARIDYRIPFDEKEEKISNKIKDIASSISSHKNIENAKQNLNGNYYDALNILLIETRREGKELNIFETKQFFISTDQSLRRWDYNRSTVTPIVILPSQWLSILLRYINRTTDDYKSFVSFLNLPNSETQIDSEKIHIILKGISEMTANFDQQLFLAQTMVQRKFEGILENGIKEEELLERTRNFVKNELEKQIEEITKKQQNLELKFDSHKQYSEKKIDNLLESNSEKDSQLANKEREVLKLRNELKNKTVREGLARWKNPAKYLIILAVLIILFTVFQLCCKEWDYNYAYKLVSIIDNSESETQKTTLRTLLYAPIAGLWPIGVFIFTRLINQKAILEKQRELENLYDQSNQM